MYCPRCSQSSDDLRFCKGCGLQLRFVHELLANNGIPVDAPLVKNEKFPLMQRKGFRVGAKFVFLSFFLAPVAIMLSIAFDSPGPLMVPALVFLVGVATALYTLLFAEPKQAFEDSRYTAPMYSPNGLPLMTQKPIALEPPSINTAEMVRPLSVTEHTTKLLDDSR